MSLEKEFGKVAREQLQKSNQIPRTPFGGSFVPANQDLNNLFDRQTSNNCSEHTLGNFDLYLEFRIRLQSERDSTIAYLNNCLKL
jgi:hypothetical protein